jgi:hypothetical protein
VLGMEEFPVEVIGTILSHIAAVEQVVRASGTCRKWERQRAIICSLSDATAGSVRLCTKTYKCRHGSVSYRDYPANFSSARFVHFDGRRNFSSGNDLLGLACSEFSSYSEV